MEVNDLSGGKYEDIVTFSLSEMLDREIEAAGRGAYPISLILVSVFSKKDGKAKESEECGKEKTANTLKSIMNSRFRITDTCFLTSDGRIIVILPFTGIEGVSGAERKIRTLFESHTMTAGFTKSYDIMINSVQYPVDGKNKDILMKKLTEKQTVNKKHTS
jgi:hypothetical protein